MKPCENAQLIHAYHDGELSSERKAFVEAHLRECAACEAELKALRGMSTTLRFAAKPAMPAGMMAQLHKRVEEQATARAEAGAMRLAGWLTAAAAAIAMACTVQLMWGSNAGGGGGTTTVSNSWETTAVLAIADARGGTVSDEYKMTLWMRDNLSGDGQ